MTTTQYSLFGLPKEIKSKPAPANHQAEMFTTHQVLQFGVNARPKLPLSPNMKLPMLHQDLDTETEEEREQRTERQARAATAPMFNLDPVPTNFNPKDLKAWHFYIIQLDTRTVYLEPFIMEVQANGSLLALDLQKRGILAVPVRGWIIQEKCLHLPGCFTFSNAP